jgi:hypothetical protein
MFYFDPITSTLPSLSDTTEIQILRHNGFRTDSLGCDVVFVVVVIIIIIIIGLTALAFFRSFCQLKYPAIASSHFVTRVFSRVGLLSPRPIPGCPEGPMFSVRVVSLSPLVPILKRQELAFCPCMTAV